MTKANKKIITPDRIKELNRDRKIAFALNREQKRGVGGSNLSGAGLGSGGSSGIDSNKFIRKAGDEMSGPLGFQLKLVQISGGVIDITEDPDRQEAGSHSSNVFVSTEGFATTDDLDTIDTAKFQGQLLFLQATLTQTVTLTSAGNIKPFGGSFDLVGDNTILLKWKTTAGKWEQMTGGTSISGGVATTDLDMGDFSIINKKSQTYNKKLNSSIPTPAANKKTVYYSSDLDEIAVKDELGIVTSLEAGASGGDNLGNHIATQDILPNLDDTHDLGSSLKTFQDLFINTIRFPKFDLNPTNFHAIYRDSSDSISLNVPLTVDEVRFRFGGLIHWQFNRSRMIGDNIILNNILALNDNGPIPAANGFIWRDTTKVHIGSGGKDVVLDELANTTLSNLAPITTINSDLRPQANIDLGSAVNIWQTVYTETLDLNQSFSINNSRHEIFQNAGDTVINVPTLADILFSYQGVTVHDFSDQTYTGKNIILSNSFILNSGGFDPAFNGEFTRNGIDVKVFSGNALRNLSDIGSGGGPEFQDNLFKIFNQFDGSRKMRFDAGAIGAGNTRTYIMQNTSGVLAMLDGAITQTTGNDWQLFGSNTDIGNATSDTLSILARIDTSLIPKTSGKDLGSSSLEWQNLFVDEVRSTDRIRAQTSTEIGFFVQPETGAVGSEGTVQLPLTQSSPGTAAVADARGGAFLGATLVFDGGNDSSRFLFIRQANGNWMSVALAQTLV